MSGHSKFANIKHKKEKNDAKKGKIFTIIGYRNYHFGRHKYLRSADLHKVCTDKMKFRFFFQINRNIHSFLVNETLPTLITIGPSATDTIDQGRISPRSISGIINRIKTISHFFPYCQIRNALISQGLKALFSPTFSPTSVN